MPSMETPNSIHGHDQQLMITPRWLISMQPVGEVLENHAVVVDAGRIVAVLPRQEAESRYSAAVRVDLPRHVLLPGLINMHTHSAMSLLRGLADDVPLMDWLENHIWPAETIHVGPQYARDGVELAAAEMLRGGVTCFNDNYFFPDIAADVARKAGMRATVGFPIIKVPTAWAKTADEYITKGLAVHQSLQGETLLRTAFAPHAPYTVSDDSFRRLRDLSEELNIPIHLHLHETAGEVRQGVAEYGLRPFDRIQKLGLLNPRLIAVHMTQMSEDEVQLSAEHGVNIVHCPESNLKLGSGICPTAELLRHGVNLCVGTDGAASNNDLDMWGEMRTASFLAKGTTGDPQVLDAPTILAMGTIHGARALGLGDETGSIEVGKSADFCAMNLDYPETQPVHNVISTIVYAAGRHQVSDVWVAGKRLLDNGELTTLDLDDIMQRAKAWQPRLKEWARS